MVHATSNPILLSLAATLDLLLVIVVARYIGDEVGRPTTNLLIEEMESSGKRCLLSQFVHLVHQMPVPGRIPLSRFGDENHVAFHMPGTFVMFTVGDFPGKVRDQKN